jgi:hypothetical protein
MALQLPERGYRFAFAYGSNMCLGRMRCRVPSACPVAVAELRQFQLAFRKRSGDGSAKGDAAWTGGPSDRVLGVVFEVCARDMRLLDTAEGKGSGYRVRWLEVTEVGSARTFKVRTYIATRSHIDPALKPYTWYRRHVLAGAEHFRLGEIDPGYVERIANWAADPDPRPNRTQRELRFPCADDVSPRDSSSELGCADSPLRPCGDRSVPSRRCEDAQ